MDHRFPYPNFRRAIDAIRRRRWLTAAFGAMLIISLGQGIAREHGPSGAASPNPSRNAPLASLSDHDVETDPDTASPRSPGPALMARIVDEIGQHTSVSARIRHRSHLFGQRLVGSGEYFQRQSERGLQVRFGLTAKAHDRTVRLLQVCDGRFFWVNDNLDGRHRLGRADLHRLRRAAQRANIPPMPKILGGGLPTLLASLKTNFVIAAPQSVTFQGIPMWALALRWKPSALREIAGDNVLDGNGRLLNDQLPPQIPDRVFLIVGQDDLFPYRIDFRRTQAEDGVQPLSPQTASRSITTMELFEVQFDAPLDAVQFTYKPPPNLRPDDLTDTYLAEIHQAAKKRTAQSATRDTPR